MKHRETLKAWQEKNHPWLELSDVHKETTENVRVTVIPFYMGCRESHNNNVYWVCANYHIIVVDILLSSDGNILYDSGGIVSVLKTWEN